MLPLHGSQILRNAFYGSTLKEPSAYQRNAQTEVSEYMFAVRIFPNLSTPSKKFSGQICRCSVKTPCEQSNSQRSERSCTRFDWVIRTKTTPSLPPRIHQFYELLFAGVQESRFAFNGCFVLGISMSLKLILHASSYNWVLYLNA
jgi:hypothetical protein